MKKIFFLLFMTTLFISCSEDIMDEINEDRNNAQDMTAENMIPDLTLKSGFETAATDLAWYSTVYAEHNAGTWNQSHQADQRAGQNNASLLNNSWNALYDVMNIAKTILDKTDPETGSEPTNFYERGVASVLMAYNLATTTDFWGEIPYDEAFMGAENLQPAYQNQSEIYPKVFELLDQGIAALGQASNGDATKDYIYAGDVALWTKAAYVFKARYHMQLSNVDDQAASNALEALEMGFESNADNMTLTGFEVALPGGNPWGEFWWERDHLSVSSTIFDIMSERNDTLRMATFFTSTDPGDIAPIGQAEQTQGGYSQSLYTTGFTAFALPVIIATYHEQKFIEAEAKFRTGAADWQDALGEAVQAAFDFHGVPMTGDILEITETDTTVVGTFNYFEDEVVPRLTAGNELEEIMTQKYIAFYDREAIQTYNDVRRTGFPQMMNPNNETVGFVNRAPFPVSEISSNGANVPTIDVFVDKIWWDGGDEKL